MPKYTHIYTFCKCFSFIWRCVLPVSILNMYVSVHSFVNKFLWANFYKTNHRYLNFLFELPSLKMSLICSCYPAKQRFCIYSRKTWCWVSSLLKTLIIKVFVLYLILLGNEAKTKKEICDQALWSSQYDLTQYF